LSVVPNNQLKASLSLEIETFPIEEVMIASPYTKDFLTNYHAVWKSLVIRNMQPVFNCQYRLQPSGPLKTLNANSERPIQGWGSFFQVITADPAPNIEIDYIAAKMIDAVKTPGNGKKV